MKITFPELTSLVAAASGSQKKKTEEFLKLFFTTVADSLERGESVKVPALGTFKTIVIEARKSVNVNTGEEYEIPSHYRVSFVPSKELAAQINAPFAAFSPVALAEGITDADLESELPDCSVEADEVPVDAEETYVEAEEMQVENAPVEAEEVHVDKSDTDSSDCNEEIMESSVVVPNEIASEDPVGADEPENENPSKVRKLSWAWILLAGVFLGLIMLIGASWADYKWNDSKIIGMLLPSDSSVMTVADDEEIAVVDKLVQYRDDAPLAADAPVAGAETTVMPDTQPSDKMQEPVYDVVSTTRYLTTIAKEHYGNYHLWPYIYIENEKILGHPDRITPGTKVVVPDLDKYGVDPKNPDHIALAKKKGAEIYARFK